MKLVAHRHLRYMWLVKLHGEQAPDDPIGLIQKVSKNWVPDYWEWSFMGNHANKGFYTPPVREAMDKLMRQIKETPGREWGGGWVGSKTKQAPRTFEVEVEQS